MLWRDILEQIVEQVLEVVNAIKLIGKPIVCALWCVEVRTCLLVSSS